MTDAPHTPRRPASPVSCAKPAANTSAAMAPLSLPTPDGSPAAYPMTSSKTNASAPSHVKQQVRGEEHMAHDAAIAPLPSSAFTPKRRRVVQGLGTSMAALSLGGLATQTAEAASSEQSPAATAHHQEAGTSTRFFTAAEFAFLTAACERLFPEDDMGPGATMLGVPDFIEGQMNTPWGRGEKWFMSGPHRTGPDNLGYQLPYSPRQIYRIGIAGTQAWVRQQHNAPFESLPPTTQDAILTALEHNATQFDALPASAFFEQLRSDTIEGAFADPIHGGNRHMGGWKMMGFPGARADYMDWVDRYETPYPYGPVSISGETG